MYQLIRIRNLIPILVIALGTILLSIYYQKIVEFPFRFEFRNYLVGKKLVEGFVLYKDIIAGLTPATALVFQFISFLGLGYNFNYVLGKIILILQGLILNREINRLNIFPQAGNSIFVIFLIFAAINPAFQLPSAQLFGLSFLILAWTEIAQRLNKNTISNRIFLIGVYLGLACSFYFTYGLFIFGILSALIAHSNISLREITLVLIGFLIIVFFNYLYLTLNDSLDFFIEMILRNSFQFRLPSKEFLVTDALFLIPFILAGIIRFIFTKKRSLSAIQNRIFQTNLILYINSLLIIPFLNDYNLIDFIYFLLPVSLLLFESLELTKRSIKREIIFLSFLALAFYSQFINITNQNNSKERIRPELGLKNKRLMVLGNQIDEYYDNLSIGPFVDWKLTNNLFNNLNNYSTVIRAKDLLENLEIDYIYDPNNQFIKLKNRLPFIYKKFKKIDDNLYIKN